MATTREILQRTADLLTRLRFEASWAASSNWACDAPWWAGGDEDACAALTRNASVLEGRVDKWMLDWKAWDGSEAKARPLMEMAEVLVSEGKSLSGDTTGWDEVLADWRKNLAESLRYGAQKVGEVGGDVVGAAGEAAAAILRGAGSGIAKGLGAEVVLVAVVLIAIVASARFAK